MCPAHPVRPSALITVNRAGLIVDWEADRENPLGWREDKLRATPLTDLIEPAARARFHTWWTRLATALPTRTRDCGIVTRLRTPRGQRSPASCTANPHASTPIPRSCSCTCTTAARRCRRSPFARCTESRCPRHRSQRCTPHWSQCTSSPTGKRCAGLKSVPLK